MPMRKPSKKRSYESGDSHFISMQHVRLYGDIMFVKGQLDKTLEPQAYAARLLDLLKQYKQQVPPYVKKRLRVSVKRLEDECQSFF